MVVKYFYIKRLQASSLLETVIAMVIISVSFGIGMMIFLNVIRSNHSFQKINASSLLQEYANNTKLNKLYYDDQEEFEEITVYKKVDFYEGNKLLLVMELEAIGSDMKLLAEWKEIILHEEDY